MLSAFSAALSGAYLPSVHLAPRATAGRGALSGLRMAEPDFDLVIVGCGATTLQLAPAVAAVAASTTVLRRTMPYVHERKAGRMPANAIGWHAWRTLWEVRNDVVTFFDGWVQLEPLVRTWYWLTNYVSLLPACLGGKRVPPEAVPRADQPVQCTRRCYDYCGFIEGIRRGTISLVDASVNAVSSFSASGLVLRDGSEVRADSVIFATGYKTIGGDDTTDLHYEARRLGPTSAPRLYLSLLSLALQGARAGRRVGGRPCLLIIRALQQVLGEKVPVSDRVPNLLMPIAGYTHIASRARACLRVEAVSSRLSPVNRLPNLLHAPAPHRGQRLPHSPAARDSTA